MEVIEGAVCLSSLHFFAIKIFKKGFPRQRSVVPAMEFKRSLMLWHCAHRMAADMAVSILIVSFLSIFV